MAMKKIDFIVIAQEYQKEDANALEEEIEKELARRMRRYTIGDPISVKIPSLPSIAVQDEIQRRYKEAGWEKLEFNEMTEGEAWLTLN